MDIIQKLQNIIYREEKRAHVRTGSELATKLYQELAFNFGQADFLIFILLWLCFVFYVEVQMEL